MNCQNKSCQYYCAGQCIQAWSISLDEVGRCKQYSPITNQADGSALSTNHLYSPTNPSLYRLKSQILTKHKNEGGSKDDQVDW